LGSVVAVTFQPRHMLALIGHLALGLDYLTLDSRKAIFKHCPVHGVDASTIRMPAAWGRIAWRPSHSEQGHQILSLVSGPLSERTSMPTTPAWLDTWISASSETRCDFVVTRLVGNDLQA
jgi:hypothetical protein